MSTFDESKHLRGQANNAGQFRAKTNSAPTGSLSFDDLPSVQYGYDGRDTGFVKDPPSREEIERAWRVLAPDATPVEYDPQDLLRQANLGYRADLDDRDREALERIGRDGVDQDAFLNAGYPFDLLRSRRNRKTAEALLERGLIYRSRVDGSYHLTIAGAVANDAEGTPPGLKAWMYTRQFWQLERGAS